MTHSHACFEDNKELFFQGNYEPNHDYLAALHMTCQPDPKIMNLLLQFLPILYFSGKTSRYTFKIRFYELVYNWRREKVSSVGVSWLDRQLLAHLTGVLLLLLMMFTETTADSPQVEV